MARRQLATGNMPIPDTRSGRDAINRVHAVFASASSCPHRICVRVINYFIKQPSVRIVVVDAINRVPTGVHTAKKK